MAAEMFARIEVGQPAYRLVYAAFEKQIVDGHLRVGDELPAETVLAEQFGVNRSTVREAIRLLEESGLVRRKSPRRLEICLPEMPELASRASRALRLHQVTFRELWEVSIAVEPISARFAALRISAPEIALLQANLEEMDAKIQDLEAVVRLDIAFHNLIARAADNRALEMVREPISILFLPAGRAILPRLRTQERINYAHRMILKGLVEHDPEVAETWMRKHIDDLRRGFERTKLDVNEPLDKYDAYQPAKTTK